MEMNLKKEEFEAVYALRCNVSVQELRHDLGLYAIPCDCDSEICQGWQMTHVHRIDTTKP